MKTLLLTCLFMSVALFSTAQDQTVKSLKEESSKNIKKAAADTAQKRWRKGGIYSLNLAQGSLTNWAAGGDDSLYLSPLT